MKFHALNCLSICDYPIKQSGYEKKLRELGFDSVHQVIKISGLAELPKARFDLILIDRNMASKMEPGFLLMVSELFPMAHILMMEEDHEQIQIEKEDCRMIAHMGKRAELNELDAVLGTVLKASRPTASRSASNKSKAASRTRPQSSLKPQGVCA